MPPANDAFAAATDLVGAGGTLTVDTTGATSETGEPNGPGALTVWYKITTVADRWVTIDTQATPAPLWDTYLAVYTGTAVNALTLVRDDDDGAPQTGQTYGTSRVTFRATAGVTYHVQLLDFASVGRSDGVLTWSTAAPFDAVTPPALGLTFPAHMLLVAGIVNSNQSVFIRLMQIHADGTTTMLDEIVVPRSDSRYGAFAKTGVFQAHVQLVPLSDTRALLAVTEWQNFSDTHPYFLGVVIRAGSTISLGSFYVAYTWATTGGGLGPEFLVGQLFEDDNLTATQALDDTHAIALGVPRDDPAYTNREWKVIDCSGTVPSIAWTAAAPTVSSRRPAMATRSDKGTRFLGQLEPTDGSGISSYVPVVVTADMGAHTITLEPHALTATGVPFHGNTLYPAVGNPQLPAPLSDSTIVGLVEGDDSDSIPFTLTYKVVLYSYDVTTGVLLDHLDLGYESSTGALSGDNNVEGEGVQIARGYVWTLARKMETFDFYDHIVLHKVALSGTAFGAVTQVRLESRDETASEVQQYYRKRQLWDTGAGWACTWTRYDNATGLSGDVVACLVSDAGAVSPVGVLVPAAAYGGSNGPVIVSMTAPAVTPPPNGDPKIDLTGSMQALFRAGVTTLGVVSVDPDPLP